MPDMEKVIKGLEAIVNDDWTEYYAGICKDALALLKAQEQKCRECGEATSKAIQELQTKLNVQEPVAVIPAVKKDGELLHEGNCPVCGMKLDWFYNGNYCGCCGQAVKWE